MQTQTAETPAEMIAKLEAQIATLREQGRLTNMVCSEAEIRLAYLKATAYVGIDKNGTVGVYGVAPQLKTRAMGLRLTVDDHGVMSVTCSPMDSSVTLFLQPGGQLYFHIDEEKEHRLIYCVRAFASSDEAEAWASQRRINNSCK